MQKALFEMNVQLSNVISVFVGETGLNILEAIVAGQRDPKQLAALCSSRIKASRETVGKSLHGNWDGALFFALNSRSKPTTLARSKFRIVIAASSIIWPNSNFELKFVAGFKISAPPGVRSRFDQNSRY